MKKYCGPITVIADPDRQHVTFEVKRTGSTSTHVSDGTMANVASWALSVAEGFTGYSIDTTPLMPFITYKDCNKSDGKQK